MKTEGYVPAGFPIVAYGIAMPFEFRLDEVPGEESVVRCECSKRILPDRQLECSGTWKDQRIVAKIFVDQINAKRDWEREYQGARAFESNSINSPRMLHAGRIAGEPIYAVLYEDIDIAETFLDAWRAADKDGRQTLLHGLITMIARMHSAGLVQGIVNINNFRMRNGKVITLDNGDITPIKATETRKFLENLALLVAQFPPEDEQLVAEALATYQAETRLPANAVETDVFHQLVREKRLYRQRKYLEKIFRECSAFICSSTFSHFVMLARRYDTDGIRELLRDPDLFIDDPSARVMDDDVETKKVCIEMEGRKLVVIRYNTKNTWHWLTRTLRRSRASQAWEATHLLRFLGISAAYPIAFMDRRYGMFRCQSYLFMEFIEGESLEEFFQSDRHSEKEKTDIAQRVAGLFTKLVSSKLTHGNMNSRNIIIRTGEPVISNPEDICHHRQVDSYENTHGRDIERFFESMNNTHETREYFINAFHEEGMAAPPNRTGHSI